MAPSNSTARISLAASAAAILLCLNSTWAATYYVSPSGNDNNSGLDPSSPWGTASKVNTSTFAPGSQVLFERGGEWRENLRASSSGTREQPIVFDAYGTGPKPRFWGSDVLNKSQFQLVPGTSSTYSMPLTESYSIFIDHEFTRSAEVVTRSSDAAVNLAYVKSNANSWYVGGGQLYLNTGGVNPATDSRVYTSSIRNYVVEVNTQNHIVIRNLVVDESTRPYEGCGFRAFWAENVRFESSEVYRGGKHHFCATDVNQFVAKDLYASGVMPDLGYGGASPYVSYSDFRRNGDKSEYINVVAENLNGPYPAFITHGEGMGDVTIHNMIVRGGAGISLATEGANQKILIKGGVIEDGPLYVGSNVTVEGVTITGPQGAINIAGNNNVIQNTLIVGRQVNWHSGNRGAITDDGVNNTIRFNTILMDPPLGGGGAAIGINGASSNTHIYGNVFSDPNAIVLYASSAQISSHDNLFPSNVVFGLFQNGNITYRTLAQWQQLGYDVNSLTGAIVFENPQHGNYALANNSPGIDHFTDPLLFPAGDLRGFPRPIGDGADIGAFERPFPGDANFDGTIDADDYALIDAAFASRNPNAGFTNGDFNFSGGPPNSDDFFIIDHAFAQQWLTQNGLLGSQGTSVPEPAALSLMAIAAAFSLRYRPHDRDPHRQR